MMTKKHGEYRVLLEREYVYLLRQRAAQESLAVGRSVTWQAVLRGMLSAEFGPVKGGVDSER